MFLLASFDCYEGGIKGIFLPATRRLAAHTGMTNKCLKDRGLVSVKELWVKIHYPATAR